MEIERSVMNGRKTPPEVCVQLPDAKVAAETGEMTVPAVESPSPDGNVRRKADVIQVILRLVCVLTSVTAVSVMASAKEGGNIAIYGFNLPVYSNWSFSHSFKYLVVVSAVVTVYSVLQLVMTASRLIRKSPFIPSRNHAWLIFAGDQLFAYAMMSAGSAASGVTNLNRTGIQHSPLPNFCKPLQGFCDRVAASIAFTFFTCFLLATSAVLDVVLLSKYY